MKNSTDCAFWIADQEPKNDLDLHSIMNYTSVKLASFMFNRTPEHIASKVLKRRKDLTETTGYVFF